MKMPIRQLACQSCGTTKYGTRNAIFFSLKEIGSRDIENPKPRELERSVRLWWARKLSLPLKSSKVSEVQHVITGAN